LEQSRSQRILWLLEELKLSYELKTFKRGKDMLAGPELKEVHPLGKSPVISVESPATTKPIVLAESGAIVEFLSDHFGTGLIPKRYQEDKEGQVGGETETWLRYKFYMHYAEGSIMSMLLIALVAGSMFLS
jgi:glutathione S-transferase